MLHLKRRDVLEGDRENFVETRGTRGCASSCPLCVDGARTVSAKWPSSCGTSLHAVWACHVVRWWKRRRKLGVTIMVAGWAPVPRAAGRRPLCVGQQPPRRSVRWQSLEPKPRAPRAMAVGADTCHARFAHACHRPPATRGRRSRRPLRVCRRRCAPAALLPVPRPRRLSRRRTRHVRRPSHARLASPPFLRRARQLSYSLSLSLVL